jgi:hypothetical protein
MIFTFMLVCGPHEKFAPTAFASQIGNEITVKTPRGDFPGRIVAAEVAGDGGLAEISVEVDGDAIPGDLTVAHWSQSFTTIQVDRDRRPYVPAAPHNGSKR